MQILSHTPAWVWIVFLSLVILGYLQSHDRSVSAARLFILPAVMIALAVYGIASAFGFSFLAIAIWAIGFALPVVSLISFLTPQGVYLTPSGLFNIPGSWLPFALMMSIFSVKYVLGVVSARHLPVIANPWFIGFISLLLGVLSGIFLARNIGIWRCRSVEPPYA